MLTEIITTVLTAIVLFCGFVKWKYKYWERLNIASMPAEFPYGSLKNCILMKETIGETLARFYRKFNDKKLMGFYGPLEPMILLRDPELIKQVLIKDFNSFCDGGLTVRKHIDPLLAYNPFGEKGLERWKASRSMHTQNLTISKLKAMSVDMIRSAENMTKYIRTKCDAGTLEVKSLVRNYAVDLALSSVFGVESDSFFKENATYTKFTKGEMFVDSNQANFAVLSGFFAPTVGRIFRWRTLSKYVEKMIIDLYKSCAEYRKKHNIVRADFLQYVMTVVSKAEQENKKFSDAKIAALCISVYGDAVDSSSPALTYALYHIASDCRVQEKLRTEIMNSIKDMSELDLDKLQTMEYLEMVISETLRLHPPIQILSRTCTKSINLDGLQIEPGRKLFVTLYGLHMDPKYYTEPDKFLPERFSKEQRTDMNKMAYLPFGEGPRMCLGFRFGMLEIKIGIVAILSKFCIKTANPKGYKCDNGSLFLTSPKGDVDITFTPL
ncbi:cytochrome P450 6a22-like [Rhodnius prolixus]|uniref:cytochrome P450 6a22-like n=1 Tax=Rhodnius prolixus TaxID=13249 RepID=UPI003D18A81B